MSNAEIIAYVAHAGQKRADGETPYIAHPYRVRILALKFYGAIATNPLELDSVATEVEVIGDAAILHDVLEDTKVTEYDLLQLDIARETIELVDMLTKRDPEQPASTEYYERITTSPLALIVKAADRCSNLEDATREVQADRRAKRWRRYLHKTEEILHYFEGYPILATQLTERMARLATALAERREPEAFDKLSFLGS